WVCRKTKLNGLYFVPELWYLLIQQFEGIRHQIWLQPTTVVFNLPEPFFQQECVAWIFTSMCTSLHVIHRIVTILNACLVKHGFSRYGFQANSILRLLIL